jgi:hypothetical protein
MAADLTIVGTGFPSSARSFSSPSSKPTTEMWWRRRESVAVTNGEKDVTASLMR